MPIINNNPFLEEVRIIIDPYREWVIRTRKNCKNVFFKSEINAIVDMDHSKSFKLDKHDPIAFCLNGKNKSRKMDFEDFSIHVEKSELALVRKEFIELDGCYIVCESHIPGEVFYPWDILWAFAKENYQYYQAVPG